MNKKLADFIFETIIRTNFETLKKSQQNFVKKHYENARLINCKGFTNLMGKSYNMTIDEFEELVKNISKTSDAGAEIVFDYVETYTYSQIEKMMSRCGYLIYEHLDNKEMAKLNAPAGVHFVLAVKKEHLQN